MKIIKMRGSKLVSLVVLVALIAALVPIVSFSGIAAAQPDNYPTTVVYNLYATDGWVQLADGTMQYQYGYIGGREGVPLNYLDFGNVPVLGEAGITPDPNGGTLQTIEAGPPAPTGGPMTPDELALAGHAQLPAPVIYARVGDTLVIRLKNLGVTDPAAPNDPHTVHLHGLDVNVANDGVPETSVAAIPANASQNGAGNVITYQFIPDRAGTFMYHCHQEADIHVQMGMYGALIIYNPLDDAAALGGPTTGGGQLYGHKYDKDIIMLLTEVDLGQAQSELGAYANSYVDPNTINVNGPNVFNPVNYKPQYWLINGLSFPNTIHAATANFNWSNWATAHPGYDPLIVGSASGDNGPQKILLRMINLGFETQPMHVHGFHPKVIGMDQRAWTWANPPGITAGQGLELNTILIGSGNTIDMLFDMSSQSPTQVQQTGPFTGVSANNYAEDTQSRYDDVSGTPTPVANGLTQFPPIPDPFGDNLASGDPNQYTGGPSVPNIFVFHNHDDYKATNNGIYPGGQFTAVVLLP
jgi:manganese oxidase